MLTRIEAHEVPDYGGRNPGEMRKFAHDALAEFVANSEVGDIVEITDFPIKDQDEVRNANKLLSALQTEIRHVKCDDWIRRFRRKGRVFMQREKSLLGR